MSACTPEYSVQRVKRACAYIHLFHAVRPDIFERKTGQEWQCSFFVITATTQKNGDTIPAKHSWQSKHVFCTHCALTIFKNAFAFSPSVSLISCFQSANKQYVHCSTTRESDYKIPTKHSWHSCVCTCVCVYVQLCLFFFFLSSKHGFCTLSVNSPQKRFCAGQLCLSLVLNKQPPLQAFIFSP